jgi:hypothetical protein
VVEVLLHLLTQVHVQTADVSKSRETKVEVQNMILFASKNFSQEGGLQAHEANVVWELLVLTCLACRAGSK